MTVLIALVILGGIVGWLILKPEPEKRVRVGSREFLNHPNVRRQLDGFQRMFMSQTIMALWQGERPPNQVGGYGVLTKKKLIIEKELKKNS